MENTMTNEAMEIVTDDVVIEAAEEIVAGNDIDLMKFGKRVGAVAVVAGLGYLFVKKGIPAIKKFINKGEVETEVVECTSEDYTEAVNADVEVEDEE